MNGRTSNRITITRFLNAAKYGDIQTVQEYIDENSNDVATAVNATDRNGTTALYYAAAGWENIVNILLAVNGINVNAVDSTGHTALMRAAMTSQANIVLALIAVNGIDVNVATPNGFTALMYALVHFLNMDTVNALLTAHNINVNVQNYEGTTPLMQAIYACREDYIPIIVSALLARHDIDLTLQNNEGETAEAIARRTGYRNIANVISSRIPPVAHAAIAVAPADEGIDVQRFLQAARDGDLLSVQGYIAANHDRPDAINVTDPASGNSALIFAAMYGQETIVNELTFIHGLNINAVNHANRTAAMEAEQNDHPRIAITLTALVSREEYDQLSVTASSSAAVEASLPANSQVLREAPPAFAARLKAINYQGEIPTKYICPISRELMEQPIVTYSSGQAYDQESLRKYFESLGNPSYISCPITNFPINRSKFNETVPCIFIRDEIENFVAAQEAEAKQRQEEEQVAASLASDSRSVSTPDTESVRTNRLRFFEQAQQPTQHQASQSDTASHRP